ncbi:MAG: menaquinone biosynthesis protein [Candidatus Riflebacteria bacterium]|nr:menaquinone biosynthesis protein [Candidatus Riflebacteria bacterium]
MGPHRARRIGWIGYVNTLPLTRALPGDDGAVIVDGVPTALNAMLAAGEIDVAPISSIEYGRHADDYVVLAGISISTHGPVRSVLVASDRPLLGLPGGEPVSASVFLTPASATSAVLLKALAATAWIDRCRLAFVDEPDRADGRLMIGDEALREHIVPRFSHHIDLGEAWRDHTGLPLVFALMCARREVLSDSRRERLVTVHRSLARAAREPDRGWASREASRRLALPEEELTRYMAGLSYELTPLHRRGLMRFLEMAWLVGEAPSVNRIRTVETEPDTTNGTREGSPGAS